MNTVNLQVPISKQLKRQAVNQAKHEGFSSLQEVVRVLLSQYASRKLQIRFVPEDVALSPQAERQYLLMDKDFEHQSNVYEAKNTKDLMKQLHDD